MKHAFSSLGCAEFTLDECLALAARHACAAVELRALDGTVDLPARLAAGFASPEALARHCRAAPVAIAALNTSLTLAGSTDDDWRKTLEAFLPWAEALGGLDLRVFDGGTGTAADLSAMAARLRWWQAFREQRGWRSDLMIETHDSLFTAAAVGELRARAPNARILWDTHHTWKKGGENPLVTWTALRPCVVHVHVKDSVSAPSARHPFTYVLPGAGEFPMAPLRERLATEFPGVVSLEWERMWHPYLPPLDDALAAAAATGWW